MLTRSNTAISAGAIPAPAYSRSRWREALAGRLGEFAVAALICASVTLPPVRIGGPDFWLKPEQLALPLVIAIYAWMLLAGWVRLPRGNVLMLTGAAYSVCVLISIWYGADVLGQPVILRDFYEFPKLWLPVAFYTLAYEIRLPEPALCRLVKVFGLAAVPICLYAWAQWAGLGFTYTLNEWYSGGVHDEALFGLRRVYSTVGNPNLLAQLMTWCLAIFLLAALYRVGNRAWNLGLSGACLVTIAMTGSRYGLITGGLTILLVFAMPSASRRQRAMQTGLLAVLVPVMALIFVVVANSNRSTLERFQTLRKPLQTDSLRDRLDRTWLDALADIETSPLFGHGPAKARYTGIVTDSEYLDVLKEFGMVGFLPYLAYFLAPLGLLWTGWRAGRRAGPRLEESMPASFALTRACFILAVLSILMNVGMSTFYNPSTQAFLWLWLGVGARCAANIRRAGAPCGSRAAFATRPGQSRRVSVF